jgi:hypothetical protein
VARLATAGTFCCLFVCHLGGCTESSKHEAAGSAGAASPPTWKQGNLHASLLAHPRCTRAQLHHRVNSDVLTGGSSQSCRPLRWHRHARAPLQRPPRAAAPPASLPGRIVGQSPASKQEQFTTQIELASRKNRSPDCPHDHATRKAAQKASLSSVPVIELKYTNSRLQGCHGDVKVHRSSMSVCTITLALWYMGRVHGSCPTYMHHKQGCRTEPHMNGG